MNLKSRALDLGYSFLSRSDVVVPGRFVPPPVLGTSIGSSRKINVYRRLASLQLPIAPLGVSSRVPLEVIFVAAPKDFEILPLAVEGAVANCGSPVSQVILVTTAEGVGSSSHLRSRLSGLADLSIISEDDVIDEAVRHKIRALFPDRYGWVLQQLLCVAVTTQTSASAVLIMDADTILLRQRALIDESRQLLLPSLENHLPYYDFLARVHPLFSSMRYSFIGHYMVQRPDEMKEVLSYCVGDFEGLVEAIASHADRSVPSPICVDFELYAQGLVALKPNGAVLAKWSNISAKRPKDIASVTLDSLRAHFSHHHSLSLHSYMA